tara:strand:+ start:1205 stop:1498 length:294 start_codon:yes stop_codon:yes gene_type:complete
MFLFFIIIVSLLFSHFIFKHSIEPFGHDKSDNMTSEDTLLNPTKANGPAPAPSDDNEELPAGYGMLKENFTTKKSSEGVFDYLFNKKESSQFTLPKF